MVELFAIASTDLVFTLFASLGLVSASLVIGASNPVHSVLFLILVFCNASGILVLYGLEFLAMILLVVYVGAIAVLFLFVVMMLNIQITQIQQKALQYLPVGGILALILWIELQTVVPTTGTNSDLVGSMEDPDKVYQLHSLDMTQYKDEALAISLTDLESLGNLLYTTYMEYFILASIILLVAMIGAIMLTHDKSRLVKRQDVYQQNAVHFLRKHLS